MYLRILRGPGAGRIASILEGGIYLGSAEDAHVRLTGEGLQPYHCIISNDENILHIEPRDGLVRLNGEILEQATSLFAGSVFTLGQVVVAVCDSILRDKPRLLCVKGPDEGKEFPLQQKSLVLGRSRDQADIAIPDKALSRKHARVFWQQSQWYIEDLGSNNGTRLAGKQLQGEALLPAGKVFSIGVTSFVFFDGQQGPATRAHQASRSAASATGQDESGSRRHAANRSGEKQSAQSATTSRKSRQQKKSAKRSSPTVALLAVVGVLLVVIIGLAALGGGDEPVSSVPPIAESTQEVPAAPLGSGPAPAPVVAINEPPPAPVVRALPQEPEPMPRDTPPAQNFAPVQEAPVQVAAAPVAPVPQAQPAVAAPPAPVAPKPVTVAPPTSEPVMPELSVDGDAAVLVRRGDTRAAFGLFDQAIQCYEEAGGQAKRIARARQMQQSWRAVEENLSNRSALLGKVADYLQHADPVRLPEAWHPAIADAFQGANPLEQRQWRGILPYVGINLPY